MDIRRYPELESTQDLAHDLAAAGVGHGTVVVAETQSKGRGTRGRMWSSSHGGLWMTVVLRPADPPAVENLSLRIGLEVAARLASWTPTAVPVEVKWPNDLVVSDRKLGGILCEARWVGDRPGWVAVGIGLNVTNHIPSDLSGQAISLAMVGVEVSAAALVEPIAEAIVAAGTRSGALTTAELDAFATRDWLRGRRLREPAAGVAEGIAADGRLVVVRDDGLRQLVLGSVALADGLAPGLGSR